ncbi:MAG: sodium:solute symporter family protein [Longimicrobiales bacterium]
MQLNALDITIALVALAISLAPAFFFAKRAGKGTAEFFASGRSAPWWLIGTSMVATTFSTDTPNLVTNFVRTKGVAANWEWWAFLLTGMATVFFFAKLWRRSGVLTDLEFYELRYSGRPASFVRGFRAVYLGLFFNCVIMGSVTLAATKIANVMLGWNFWTTVAVCALICIPFASMSGLWGVLAIDMVQFVIAMFGVFAAAWFALDHPAVGGLAGLVEKIPASTLGMVPDFSDWELALAIFIVPLTIQWWSVWYPGAEPGGGSYIAQRMLAARTEKDAFAGTLWFNVAHYALRPWPWIIVALASMIVFPTLGDIQEALPHVSPDLLGDDMAYPAMLTLLPHGILGMLVAALTAAYISTMVTHLNWGSSYIVMDFYKRFLRPSAGERHLVSVSRIVTGVLMIVAIAVTRQLDTAVEAFGLLLSIGAGTGLIYLLRWFWWRINAWSEIAAMISSFIIALGLFFARKGGLELSSHRALIYAVAGTTLVWVTVTFLTPPVDRARLVAFYKKVRPAGPGWRMIREEAGLPPSPDSLPQAILGWTLGCLAVYGALFTTGNVLYGRTTPAIIFGVITLISSVWLYRILIGILGAPSEEEAPAAE